MSIATRIKQFRTNLGIKKIELAAKLGVSPALITYYESGQRQPSLKTVMQMSDIFKVPLEYILTDKEYKFQVACRNKGKKDSQKLMEIAEFGSVADNYSNLMEMSGSEVKYTGPTKYQGRLLNDKEIGSVKSTLLLPDIVDYQSLSESLWKNWGLPVFSLPFKPRDLSGLTIRRNDHFFIFINSGHSDNRTLFSLAHEIGHVLMHLGDGGFSTDFSPRSIPEKQAQNFAQRFLVPPNLLIEQIRKSRFTISQDRIRELAESFNVSYDCMVYNLNKLDLINYADPRSKSPEPKKPDYGLGWNYKLFPPIYLLLVYKAWSAGQISISKASSYLNADNVETMGFFKNMSGFQM